jgi:hypothetical protein
MERFDRPRAVVALMGAAGTLLLFAAAVWMTPPGESPPAGVLSLPPGVLCVGCIAAARQGHLVDVLLVVGAGLGLGWWFGADAGTRRERPLP